VLAERGKRLAIKVVNVLIRLGLRWGLKGGE
jgi:hypothetical protein